MKTIYTPQFFSDSMPDWKKKKDPIFLKFLYRPVSFYLSSFFANMNISANIVTILSLIIVIAACFLYYIPSYVTRIIGAILINLWLLLDCVDGNLARSVRQQPYGDFLDALGSYLLVGFIGISFGFNVYQNGGVFAETGDILFLLLGAFASCSDTLMRLTYQKFKNTSIDLENRNIIEKVRDIRTEHQSVSSLRVRIEMELGIGGILPPVILFCTIANALDLVIIYMFCYSVGACIVTIFLYIKKTLKYLNVPM